VLIATKIERMIQRDKDRKSEPLVERQRERFIKGERKKEEERT